MTDIPEDLFAQIYRRAPTDEDRARLTGVKAALGLSSRDEFWPLMMVLDHYDRGIRSGRAATIQELKSVITELKKIPETAGPIARAEAQKAISRTIENATNKIAEASAKRSITTADRVSKRQWIVAMIAGGITAAILAAAGAFGMYLILDARGICSEAPFIQDGITGCVIER